jgi:hypothetical protein
MNSRLEIKSLTSTPDPAVDSQVQLLRSRVEAELKKPAVVMVTSAHSGDGKSLTASSLATSFAKAGHRAALVSENLGSFLDSDALVQESPAHGHVAKIELPPETDNAVSREGLAAFVSAMRSNYDYAIVDAGSFLDSNSAMALPGLVDGILLSVRVGRASTGKDEMMVRMIEHLGSTVLGVVAADPAAITAFERSAPKSETTRLRHLERQPTRVLATTVLAGAMFAALASSSPSSQTTFSGIAPSRFGAQVAQVTTRVRDAVSRYTSIPLLTQVKE